MPASISISPISCFFSGISRKNRKLNAVTKIYPVASSSGDIESGTTFSPYIDNSVQRKNTAYDVITGMLRYSLSFELYFFPADFFNSICENDDMSELSTRSSAYLVSCVM